MAFKSLILLSFILVSGFGLSARSQTVTEAYELKLQIIHLGKSQWKTSEIQKNIRRTRDILSQCGVQISSAEISRQNTFDAELMFDLEGYSSPDDTLEPNGALKLASLYPAHANTVRVFLFDQFDPTYASITATSVPRTRITQKDQLPALNTLWLTHESERQLSFSVQDGGYQPDYNILAHELGHLLLDDSHFTDALNFNLMHESASMLNSRLTQTQCQKIIKSELLKPLNSQTELRHDECRDSSPLSGRIIFLDEEAKACNKATSLVKNLEAFHDRVSEMAPVHNLNFYLSKPGNTIQHLDRGAFEASLIATHDDYGKIPLSPQSTLRLWKHEMGHAILNAQLSVDWPWYAERSRLYQQWETYILQSTFLEKDIQKLRREGRNTDSAEKQLDALSAKSNAVFNQIRNLPSNYEFENLLSPYHEVFSDAVVILDEMNPKAISEALKNPADPQMLQSSEEEKRDVVNRDYSYVRDVNIWNEDEVHTKLTPALAYYWSRLAGKKLTDSEKRYYVRQFYEAIKSEVLELSAAQKFELSPKEANTRLIQKLQKIHILN